MTPFYLATRAATVADMVERLVSAGIAHDDATAAVALATRGELFKNDTYQVSIDKHVQHGFGEIDLWHLSIRRLDREAIHDWRDLQAIKDQLVGPECEAVELYPAAERLIDTANQYHLYACPNSHVRFPFGMFGPRSVGTPEEAAALGAKQRGHV